MEPTTPAKKRHLLRNFVLIALAPFVLLFGCYGIHEASLTPEDRAKERADIEARRVVESAAKATVPVAQTEAEAKDEARFELAVSGASSLKSAMRNPDSFKLASVILMPSDAVCYQYRAQNGFGGMNVERAVLTPSGVIATDGGAWSRYCVGRKGKDQTRIVAHAASGSMW